MFKEIDRILKDNGLYICITLAESYILETLLSFFTSNNNTSTSSWGISIDIIENIKPSPFQAFFFVLQKKSTTITNTNMINFYVDNLGNRMASGQAISADVVVKSIASIQEFHQKQFEIGTLKYVNIIIIVLLLSSSLLLLLG
jgi:hypothetical protein